MHRTALRGVGAAGRRPSPPPSRPIAPIPALNDLKRPGTRLAPLDSQGGPADPRAGGGQFMVTPWGVSCEIDYDRLVEQFGTEHITDALHWRVRRAAGEDHFMLRRRRVLFAPRPRSILDVHESSGRLYLYTGRGPSGRTHVGHLLPWVFAK